MDAGLLDVLHDSADVELGSVVERVDVDLERVVEEPVDQQRRARADDRLLAHPIEVVLERRGVVDDLHAAAAEHVARPHEHRVADRLGDRRPPTAHRSPCRCAAREARPRRGCARTRRAPPRGRSPRARFRGSGTPAASSPFASPSAVWPPSCTITPTSSPDCDSAWMTSSTSSRVERLEVEPVARVVVGRHGLRVAVDHDRLEAGVVQREAGVHAGVVELDALPDAVRARAEDDDLLRRSLGATSVSRS